MLVCAGLAGVFLWAFLANLRWIGVPEPVIEVNETPLKPGQGTRLHIRQGGPIRASVFTVSLVCEVNAIPGKPPHFQEVLLSARDICLSGSPATDPVVFDTEFALPATAKFTCKSVPATESSGGGGRKGQTAVRKRQIGGDLVSWFLRVERTVAAKTVLQSDFEILVVESD